MDAFKLVFETVLVGALAFPCIGLMMVLLNRNISSPARLVVRIVPTPCVPASIGFIAFSFAYLLGSAISPVAQEFLNDMDSIGLPTQDKIQARIVNSQEASHVLSSRGSPRATLATFSDTREQERMMAVTNAIFHRQESAVLLGSAEASERLNRLHERLTVLTAATFSGFALSLLCVFAWCSTWRNGGQAATPQSWLRRSIRQGTANLPGMLIIFWALSNLKKDWPRHSIDDPPIMELVLLILGIFGLCVTARRIPVIASLGGKIIFVSFLTVLSYGGYISTEPIYVHDVMDSYAAMISLPPSSGPHSAASAFTPSQLPPNAIVENQ